MATVRDLIKDLLNCYPLEAIVFVFDTDLYQYKTIDQKHH